MTKAALFCSNCNRRLTDWLQKLTSMEEVLDHCRFDEPGANKVLDVEPVPKGMYLPVKGALLEEFKNRKIVSQHMVTEHWLNPYDLTSCVVWAENIDWMVGCCDVDGDNGANRECLCGQNIGTQFADCFQWHLFVPDESTTHWQT